ncbi:unnamed protein product [Rotaria sordida]|uniref:Uncharacterized protein n=1 Tax=Rotaria sordida TaxID=392033 RepID=A0A818MPP9_9BILA|nr:unnamed protein product [Rotaria sordida]
MKFTRACFLLILLALVTISESLRCAQLCAFIRIPINGSIPVNNTCKFIERDNSQCSVLVEIDHQKRVATGRLGIERCDNTDIRRVETIVKLNSALLSIIQYTCKENGCDVDFLNHLFARVRDIPEVDTTSIKQNISDLVYNENVGISSINCTSYRSCQINDLCQAKFEIEDSLDDIFIQRNENITCYNPSTDDYLLNIKQNYLPNNTQMTEMIFRCNLANCIDNLSQIFYYFLAFTFSNIANH